MLTLLGTVMIFPFSSLSLIRSENRKNQAFRVAPKAGNSYLLTTARAFYRDGRGLGGSGGVHVALGQVLEAWRRL
jgi:hypothetical protein